MNAREAIHFIQSPTGAFVAFCLLVVVAVVLATGFKPAQATQATPPPAPRLPASTQTVQTVVKDMVPFNPPKPATNTPAPTNVPPATSKPESGRLPISLYAETPSASEPKPLSRHYAPYGRLIPCQLVVTIDSSRIQTPIIGLVTENVYHGGQLVIPAGTEVHGTAQTDRSRERISSGTRWTLVWQHGEELTVTGVALDREQEPAGDGWAITDGSAGLRGRLVKSDDLAEIKLFAATFLSGAASALTERERTVFGTMDLPSLRNAPFKGAQDVLTVYARQILETIQRDGFYVRVPAGKQFYLYVTQTIDKDNAVIGGTRFDPFETNTPPSEIAIPPLRPTPPQPQSVEP